MLTFQANAFALNNCRFVPARAHGVNSPLFSVYAPETDRIFASYNSVNNELSITPEYWTSRMSSKLRNAIKSE